eukprot:2643691-Pyramimonas_sp.AAC.1
MVSPVFVKAAAEEGALRASDRQGLRVRGPAASRCTPLFWKVLYPLPAQGLGGERLGEEAP